MTPQETSLVPAGRNTALLPLDQTAIQCILTLAENFSKSGYFSNAREVSKAATIILAGRELGVGFVAALNNIYWVNNRMTIGATLMASIVDRSSTHKYEVLEHTNEICRIGFFRRDTTTSPWESRGVSVYSMDDAKRANLAGKTNWKMYPRNMLFHRALSNGCRFYVPGLFGGSPPYTPEEIDPDIPMRDDGSYAIEPPPRRVEEDSNVIEAEIVLDQIGLDPLISATGTDPLAICEHYGVASLVDLTPEQARDAAEKMRAKLLQIGESVPVPVPVSKPEPKRKTRGTKS
jgi:hypothetical protein